MAANNSLIYITYIEKFDMFLKVWGQTDRAMSLIIEKTLQQMLVQFESGLYIPSIEQINNGILCCAKYKDGIYYRARIISIAMLPQQIVDVHFIDFGNRDLVPISNIRTIANFTPGLISIPPQATEFVLANVTHKGNFWDNDTLAIIGGELRYMEFAWSILAHIGHYTLIQLFKNGEEAMAPLFHKGLLLYIKLTTQQMMIQSALSSVPPGYPMISHAPIPATLPQRKQVLASVPTLLTAQTSLATVESSVHPVQTPIQQLVQTPMQQPVVLAQPPTQTIATYKSISLEPGTECYVYISYVSDGPCHFSVQQQRLEGCLTILMKELNRMILQPLEDDPIPGTVCVARCIEDEHICRAVVTSMVDGQYKVFYVDFGNTEIVPLDNLYQIPFKYVLPKVMAMRYALAGLERSSVTLEMKCVFKEFVSDKLFLMKALPPPTRSALPLCMLWDENNVNVLDVLKKAALLAYPDVMQLTRGFSQEVIVSYVYSCSRFYIQIKSKAEELKKVMDELQITCPNAKMLIKSQIKSGTPCCSLYDQDNVWYRAQVINLKNDYVQVRYVDYGNEETVSINNLRVPNPEQLTVLRPQALECCLSGYQNMEDDPQRDNILEELILEKEFVMKVVEMQGNRALIDLIDSSRYNVASLLLEKLAAACSQVSPMLVQDNHHIEQRKSKSSPGDKDGHYKTDFKSSRDRKDNKGWNQDINKQESWRQNKPPRHDEKDTEDTYNGKGRRDDYKKFNRNENSDFKENWRAKDGKERNNSSKREGWNNSNNDDFKKGSWDNSSDGEFKKGSWNHSNNDDFRKSSRNNVDGESKWRHQEKSPSQNFSRDDKGSCSDGSEQSWGKNTRSNTQRSNKFESRKKAPSFANAQTFNKQDISTIEESKVIDPAPKGAEFTYPEITKGSRNVLISWFYDPTNFFCQLLDEQESFRTMMSDIQTYYLNIKPDHVSPGTPVIAVYPDDGIMYRGQLLEITAGDYRVQFVDFGNISITSKVWPIENKFMKHPVQAISCGLNGITRIGDTWPAPDSYSSHFSESLVCSFIEQQDQKWLVELKNQDQSISEILVSNGLAAYSGSTCTEEFEPFLLLGQQLRGTITEVEGLDAFYVDLQNGIRLPCTLHNLESATEKHEDVLQKCMGINSIIYVDNVLEEKFEVTIYDTTGNKLNIIEPDEGAYDTIDALCLLPVMNSSITGWISYINKSAEDKYYQAFLQPSAFATSIAQLLENLYEYYENSEPESVTVEEGKVYAVHSSDANWYRGQVTSIDDDKNVAVVFCDYGNSETVSVSEIRTLTEEFMMQHQLALKILTENIDESFIEQEVIATVWYDEAGWMAEVQKVQKVQSSSETELPTTQESAPPIQADTIQPEIPLEPQKLGVSVIVSHIDSPSEFYIQFAEDMENINNLQVSLQESVLSFPLLEMPTAGVLCAALYSVDDQWYRAQVLDADSDITTVRFVDYGNTDVLNNSGSQVRTLPPELLSLEQHARRCSLQVKALDTEWSSTAYEYFESSIETQDLQAVIIHQDEKTTYIELYADGKNISEMLINQNLAVKLQLEIESSCTGYISHLNSPSEFWIQMENSVADLEWIAEQLSAAESFPELEDYTPGSLCAALFQDDEMWYRARILSNTVAGLEVLFIDYGNSCICTGLRQLPEDLIMLSALAQKCCLQKPPGILQWSTYATEQFKNISADGAAVFTIVKYTTGETSAVKLCLEEVDISNKLMPQTEEAVMTFYEDISSFWLQKDKDRINTITNKLQEAAEWDGYEYKEGSPIVAAISPIDNKWYRVQILSKTDSDYEVLCIDFGNKFVTSDIRVLPTDIENEISCAKQYKLEPLPGYRWNEESSKQLRELYNEGTKNFQVEFVTSNTVTLYVNGNDIRANLDMTSSSSTFSTPIKVSKPDAKQSNHINDIDTNINGNEFIGIETNGNTIDDKLLVEGVSFYESSVAELKAESCENDSFVSTKEFIKSDDANDLKMKSLEVGSDVLIDSKSTSVLTALDESISSENMLINAKEDDNRSITDTLVMDDSNLEKSENVLIHAQEDDDKSTTVPLVINNSLEESENIIQDVKIVELKDNTENVEELLSDETKKIADLNNDGITKSTVESSNVDLHKVSSAVLDDPKQKEDIEFEDDIKGNTHELKCDSTQNTIIIESMDYFPVAQNQILIPIKDKADLAQIEEMDINWEDEIKCDTIQNTSIIERADNSTVIQHQVPSPTQYEDLSEDNDQAIAQNEDYDEYKQDDPVPIEYRDAKLEGNIKCGENELKSDAIHTTIIIEGADYSIAQHRTPTPTQDIDLSEENIEDFDQSEALKDKHKPADLAQIKEMDIKLEDEVKCDTIQSTIIIECADNSTVIQHQVSKSTQYEDLSEDNDQLFDHNEDHDEYKQDDPVPIEYRDAKLEGHIKCGENEQKSDAIHTTIIIEGADYSIAQHRTPTPTQDIDLSEENIQDFDQSEALKDKHKPADLVQIEEIDIKLKDEVKCDTIQGTFIFECADNSTIIQHQVSTPTQYEGLSKDNDQTFDQNEDQGEYKQDDAIPIEYRHTKLEDNVKCGENEPKSDAIHTTIIIDGADYSIPQHRTPTPPRDTDLSGENNQDLNQSEALKDNKHKPDDNTEVGDIDDQSKLSVTDLVESNRTESIISKMKSSLSSTHCKEIDTDDNTKVYNINEQPKQSLSDSVNNNCKPIVLQKQFSPQYCDKIVPGSISRGELFDDAEEACNESTKNDNQENLIDTEKVSLNNIITTRKQVHENNEPQQQNSKTIYSDVIEPCDRSASNDIAITKNVEDDKTL